jgi:hypothetical protein
MPRAQSAVTAEFGKRQISGGAVFAIIDPGLDETAGPPDIVDFRIDFRGHRRPLDIDRLNVICSQHDP